jgi:hypothetical protein
VVSFCRYSVVYVFILDYIRGLRNEPV